jgi:methyl-accepting chemotaxis protein
MDWFTRIAPIRQKMAVVVSTMAGSVVVAALIGLIGALAGYPLLGFAGALAVAAVVVPVGLAMRRGVCDSYVTTVVRMEGLAAGDLDAPIQFTDYRDCVGRMTKAMFTFRDAAVANQTHAREQAAMVTLLGQHLAHLRGGDLTTRIEADLPADYAVLRTNFNDAIAAICDLIGVVADSATAIRTGSDEIAQASENLARRTESNAASLEETAASVTQMDGRLRASAEAATRTVERADQAIATVGGGRAVADEAVQAMGRVSDSAKGIDSVIEGLDKIAFQTRVLAMNAAVEAGRAGDAGRGFAVVADLVSALAMRAEEEAKRARDQLTVTQTDILTAVDAVTKVDGALQAISGDVAQVHELLGTMASDNQAQSAAITEISSAIGTMDQSTQQNAAMVEETSAAARNLAGEVSNLAEQAARFNVGRTMAAPRRAAPARVVTAPSMAHKIAYASPVRPLPSAAIPAMVRADDDWNEF